MTDYWQKGGFIFDETTNKHYIVTTSDKTSQLPIPHGILSDTIIPSFSWSGRTFNDTPIELFGNGYVWTNINASSQTQRNKFIIEKGITSFIKIYIIGTYKYSQTMMHKAWEITIVSGIVYDEYDPIFTILQNNKTVIYGSTGTESWDVSISAETLDTTYDYLKLTVTGNNTNTTIFNATAMYINAIPIEPYVPV